MGVERISRPQEVDIDNIQKQSLQILEKLASANLVSEQNAASALKEVVRTLLQVAEKQKDLPIGGFIIDNNAPLQNRRASDFPEPCLPAKISSIEDALRMDGIFCLEDGALVTDLEAHLEIIGMSVEEYFKRWDLPPEYPLRSPNHIMKKGVRYEYDPTHDCLVKIVS